jgi:CubicO group peptidase (beta-lactamase class C family)
MSSGLYPVDSFGMEYATGSGLSYWAGDSSVNGARNRGLIRQPGSHWDYENYNTLLAINAMKRALGDDKSYLEYPQKALFNRIGMQNTLVSTDRFGDFIFSSQVYTNARDLARFGLLYLNNGLWGSQQLVSPDWIDFVRTPAPSTAAIGNVYGGQYLIIVPSHNTIIVRRGLDYGEQGFNRWDLTREVLKAIEPQ